MLLTMELKDVFHLISNSARPCRRMDVKGKCYIISTSNIAYCGVRYRAAPTLDNNKSSKPSTDLKSGDKGKCMAC